MKGSTVFYVVPFGATLVECCGHTYRPEAKPFDTYEAARASADGRHCQYDSHWQVVKAEVVFTTVSDD